MHDGLGADALDGGEDGVAVLEIALDQRSARIDGAAMALGEVVENGDVVALVEELLDADAADVSGSAGDE